MPPSLRRLLVITGCAIPLLLLGLFAANESRKSSILALAQQGEKTAMLQMSQTIESTPISRFDGEALLLAGQYEVDSEERRGMLLERAVEAYPAPRAIRLYVRWLAEQPDQLPKATTILKRVFVRDPYNLLAWRLLLDLEDKAGNEMNARTAAEKLVEIEGTTYYSVNSLGDLVTLETSEARVWLAEHDKDAARQVAILKPAVANYVAYAKRTVPLVKLMAKAGLTYGGQSKAEAMESIERGVAAAELLKQACQKSGDAAGAQSASVAKEVLEAACADF